MSPKVKWQRVGLVLLDAILVVLSLYAAYLLRFNFEVPTPYYRQYLLVVAFFVLVRLGCFWGFNLYRGILRYASTSEMLAIFFSTTLGTAILSALNLLVIPFVPAVWGVYEHAGHMQRVALAILIIEYVVTFLLVGGGRFSRRLMLSGYFRRADTGDLRRVLIVGAGDAGEAVARQMKHSPVRAYLPVAFIDDDPNKQHRWLHGIPVAGKTGDIPAVLSKYDAQEVLIAIPGIKPGKLREIVDLCEHAHVGFKIIPSIKDVFQGRVSINAMRPVEIEDLLGREEVRLELGEERNYLKGETVLVTGAGGSIGSELVRQVLRFEPKRIVLLGHGENSIYEIAAELNPKVSPGKLCLAIADVRDEAKIRAVVEEYRPTIFFHAAAHKHVPLMELHPDEAIKNNVRGTLNVARAAEAIHAKKFIMISSDKAVRPTNVMGATKRVAEMMVFCMAKTSRTQFVAVRFGNVLGSRGSVIPLFKKQIAQGGPVTVTHAEVTRFFMTIPEAVSLVIQAGSAREQRRLFLLDMGEPVRIIDLARNLVRLSGFEPDKDIEIRVTGLRPGEKLKEELLTAGENVKATDMGKIFMTEPDEVDCAMLFEHVAELERLAAAADAQGVRRKLRQLVPDYCCEPMELAQR
jgi:FlaA1/EpsC-like NDP-sugar epimerase